MKPILESEETFEAYATIDYCYYMLQEVQEKINTPQPAINRMVDSATGFDEVRLQQDADDIISLLRQVIKAKKAIDADYSGDKEMLDKMVKLAA